MGCCSESSLRDTLDRAVLLLDGATGTELTRRGVPTPLPLWSAGALLEHPDVVRAIHRDYAAAGADIIVANTFRTNVRTLRGAGLLERGEELNRKAIELAREGAREGSVGVWPASDGSKKGLSHQRERSAKRPERSEESHFREAPARRVLVAASVAPVEDCYHPERVPDEATLWREHMQMMDWLAATRPDLIWIETMNTLREARAAVSAAREHRLPFVVSFVTRETGDLLSGEPLERTVDALEPLGPLAFGLNCIPPDGMTRNLPRLREATRRPLIAYAHIGNPEPICGWSFSQDVPPDEYAEHARSWIEIGARIVGGCCGTRPEHIRALGRHLF